MLERERSFIHAHIHKQTHSFLCPSPYVRPQKYCDLETIKQKFKQTCESAGIPLGETDTDSEEGGSLESYQGADRGLGT